MDWSNATHDHKPTPRAIPPAPTLIEPAWCATSPTGKLLTCGLFQGVAGRVEVRASFPGDDLIRSELARDIEAARRVAEQWRVVATAKGFSRIDD